MLLRFILLPLLLSRSRSRISEVGPSSGRPTYFWRCPVLVHQLPSRGGSSIDRPLCNRTNFCVHPAFHLEVVLAGVGTCASDWVDSVGRTTVEERWDRTCESVYTFLSYLLVVCGTQAWGAWAVLIVHDTPFSQNHLPTLLWFGR